MRVRLGALRERVRKAAKTPSRWYHLSSKDLGDTFTFTPRVPKAPFEGDDGWIIEDDFTRRSSWAPSIKKALGALENPYGYFHVYATDDLPGEVDLPAAFKDCPTVKEPKNRYGDSFMTKKWINWAQENDVPNNLIKPGGNRSKTPRALKACVPDAPRTGEHWATEPVTAMKIKVIQVQGNVSYGSAPYEEVPMGEAILRRYVREVILISEVGANGAFPGVPYGRNVLSPDINDREQLGAISAKAIDTVGDDEGLPDHLREPQMDPADCYGPVPPDSEPVHVGADPFARDYGVLPTGNIKR